MKQHILIVDDEPAIADTLLYLLRAEGFDVTYAQFGYDAIEIFRVEPIDLVVLDVGLPDLNGFEVCKLMRQEKDRPILFLTARDNEIDRVVGLEIGADDYVVKPFSPREVVARIRVILRRYAPKHANISVATNDAELTARDASAVLSHKLGNFELDVLAARIKFCGKVLVLTRYEYLLLKAFIEHPERVFSRAHLMELVWVDALDTLDRTVDAHVKSLRSKLREINSHLDPIKTHRGLGYSLSAQA